MKHKYSFEKSEKKRLIRAIMMRQTIQSIQSLGLQEFKMASLPANTWTLEENLAYRLDIPKHFYCYERNPKVFNNAKDRPFAFDKNNSKDTRKARFYRDDINQINITYKKEWFPATPFVDMTWADYCGSPSQQVIDNLFQTCGDKKYHGKLYYLTVDTMGRAGSKKFHTILRKCQNGNGVSKGDYFVQQIEREFKKLNIPFTRICKFHYIGTGDIPMLTVGWHIKKNSKIAYVERDLTKETKTVVARTPSDLQQSIIQAIKKGWNNKKIMAKYSGIKSHHAISIQRAIMTRAAKA